MQTSRHIIVGPRTCSRVPRGTRASNKWLVGSFGGRHRRQACRPTCSNACDIAFRLGRASLVLATLLFCISEGESTSCASSLLLWVPL